MPDFEITFINHQALFQPVTERAKDWLFETHGTAQGVALPHLTELAGRIYGLGFTYRVNI